MEERRIATRQIRRALLAALQELPAEDRWLIQHRYTRQRPVALLARQLQADPKLLYRRCERTLRVLRTKLAAAGVTGMSPQV